MSKPVCDHRWFVYSTALCPCALMVECKKCKESGIVKNFTQKEWDEAFGASSNPYLWKDNSRVRGEK